MLELPKAYEARRVEAEIYRRWEAAGCFRAGAGARAGAAPYVIAIPPPNVTGVLHMGHALNNTLQDTLIRWKRMQGYDVLWQPGTDHAGIATESVVAKQVQDSPEFIAELAAAGIRPACAPDPARGTRTGLDRDAFGREAFLRAVWHWKERSGGVICEQLRKLGASCDWSRERFTMDEGLSRAVRVFFVRLYRAGLIYRGTRMVNWCPIQRTALADDEVDYLEKQGHLWKLKYELVEGGGHIVVETTRPETFFGDTAVAVHPDDARYRHLIGKRVRLPVIGREIPIIADPHADPEKGSGAVKITPAHDPNDYEVGQRHGLPLVRVIDFDGTMTAEAGPYAGLERFACRKRLLEDFAASGVLLGATAITHAVGHSYRSGAPIEPMVTEQWFVRMRPLAEQALALTPADGPAAVEFHPQRWRRVYRSWLLEVRDWCISRQIWWGHRIPAWRCRDCQRYTVAEDPPAACEHCRSPHLEQDPDVLDTWFSSALWPFSTLGWPDPDPMLARYYPTSTLVTDRGIIFFWVARMVMAGSFALGTKPFHDVYIHGTVLDERGEKMSKSKGNGIDPIIMIEGGTQRYLGKDYHCPGYGADAVRFTLLDMTTEGQDLKLSPTKFETGRNFANKVWNAGRFLLSKLAERPLADEPAAYLAARREQLAFPERWILAETEAAIAACDEALQRWRFSAYVGAAYRFFRDDLCDWYLEWSKRQFRRGGQEADDAAHCLAYCFDTALRLLHPGMPFITEYLWQLLQQVRGTATSDRFLMLSAWPTAPRWYADGAELVQRMQRLQAVVTGVRHARNLIGVPESTALAALIAAPDAALIDAERAFVCDRAHLAELTVAEQLAKPPQAITTVVGSARIHIPVAGLVDLGKLRAQLMRKAEQLAASIAGKTAKLANPDYVQRAPEAQVTETRTLLAAEQAELATIREALADL
ncbi:MAG: valine--tRNA ligase [Planctomycetes bacterium]|nr:valine--tRNA ligase [Planctomycetota bacterium]